MLFQNSSFTIMNLLLPYIDPPMRPLLIRLLLLSELQNSIKQYNDCLSTQDLFRKKKTLSSPFELINTLSPFLEKGKQNELQQLMDTFEIIELWKEFSELSDLQEQTGSSATEKTDLSSLLKGYLTKEQLASFEQVKNIIDHRSNEL